MPHFPPHQRGNEAQLSLKRNLAGDVHTCTHSRTRTHSIRYPNRHSNLLLLKAPNAARHDFVAVCRPAEEWHQQKERDEPHHVARSRVACRPG